MATATKTYETRTVEKTVTVEERVPLITLTLTVDEAETLRAIAARVGGSPTGSPRMHTDAIDEALRLARVRDSWASNHPSDLVSDRHQRSGIRFDDYPTDGA